VNIDPNISRETMVPLYDQTGWSGGVG
jgi:hypothetical protein